MSKDKKGTYLLPGTYVAHKPIGVKESIEDIVRRVMNDNGYPVSGCEQFCNPADFCETLERFGCRSIGGSHPPATLTNNAGPFSFNALTQAGNIPQAPTLVNNGDGTFTFTTGDGSAPINFNVIGGAVNGLTKVGSVVELGGTLTHDTLIDTLVPHDLIIKKENVYVNVNNTGFGSFGASGESVSFRGIGPSVSANVGIYTNSAGNPSYGMNVNDTVTDFYVQDNVSLPLQKWQLKTGLSVNVKGFLLESGVTNNAMGHYDSSLGIVTSFRVEEVTTPTATVVLQLKNCPQFPNDAAAAAALPSTSIWRDNSNFLKIVP